MDDLPRYSPEGNNYIYTISEVNIPFGYAYSQMAMRLLTHDGVSRRFPIPPANKIDSYTEILMNSPLTRRIRAIIRLIPTEVYSNKNESNQ